MTSPLDKAVFVWAPVDSVPDSIDAEGDEGESPPAQPARGGWNNKLDFLFSCISVSVGLGNVWRFPYLCYKNGGGAFLVTYAIAMIFCGIPIFFQEVAIGQYLGSGGMTLVGSICPILKGTGYATMTIVFFLDVYYCIIIAWTLFYLISTYTRLPGLPWEHCDNDWNSPFCVFNGSMRNSTFGSHLETNATSAISKANSTTPVEEYWQNRVLQITDGLHDLAGMQWELLGLLILAWCIVYFVISKGLNESGKIIWFTAMFPYVIMLALLGRAVTLDGAIDGLAYFVTPDWSKLGEASTWIDGATQIFFGYSVGVGTLPALGSYNSFHHNCYKDAVITCIINTLTCLLAGGVTFSILGYIAFTQGTGVANVVQSGPGLVFITYPEVVLQLPFAPLWATLFFVMLAILGIDSEFCNVESFVTGVVDQWPQYLRPRRRMFTICVCLVMFLLGIPMVTKGGAYVFQIMDFYAASGMSLLWVCFFQTIAISWFFGAERFAGCVYEMTGKRVGRFWHYSWVYFAPMTMLGIFLFYCVQYEPVKYGSSYTYPWWAEMIGLFISLSSMLWIPGYAIYYICTSSGSLKERIQSGLQPAVPPSRKRKSIAIVENTVVVLPMSDSTAVLLKHT